MTKTANQHACPLTIGQEHAKKPSRSVPPEPELLPPCRICGGKASGFHYGINSCEACKGFFRRSLKLKQQYKCTTRSQSCAIERKKARLCPFCRYQKCLTLGMSRTAIRTGRYSHTVRTQNIEEIKLLNGPPLPDHLKERCERKETRSVISIIQSVHPPNNLEDSGYHSWSPDSPNVTKSRTLDNVVAHKPSLSSVLEDTRTVLWPCLLGEDQSGCSPDSPCIKENPCFNDIIYTIRQANQLYSLTYHVIEDQSRLERRQRNYYEELKQRERLFGTLKPLTREEHRSFFEATGIDLDDRHKKVKDMLNTLEDTIVKLVQFSKCIPQFNSLDLLDQASLLKASRFEYCIMEYLPTVNTDLQIVTYPSGECFSFKEFCHFDDEASIRERFAFVQCLSRLKLTIEEQALLKAIIITFADRTRLNNARLVESIQLKLIQCFQYLLQKNHLEPKQTFFKVWDKLIFMRNLTYRNTKLCEQHLIDYPEIKETPLLYECIKELCEEKQMCKQKIEMISTIDMIG